MNIYKNLKIAGYLLLLFLISCKTSFYTEKAVPLSDENKNGIIYALPKSKIIVKVEITKEKKQKGIFADYTHLYFNTKNAVLQNDTKYFISDITIKTIPVVDSMQIYRIVSPENINPLLLNLTKESFISGINLSDIQAGKVNSKQNLIRKEDTKSGIFDYADISLHSVREIRYDTIYKEVMRDSVMIKIPVIRKKEVYKSKAKQAKETADMIFNLRDDRYALLTGENDGDNFPDGNAVKLMLKELSELEKNYMSLFTGREINIRKTYQFEIDPMTSESENKKVLFYFSDNKGITSDTSDVPVIINFVKKETSITNSFSLNDKNKGIIYRIPGKTAVDIIFKGKELYKTELEITQAGTLNLIPANLFKEKITVEFYPELGALKRISK